jgi:hypothetical protein
MHGSFIINCWFGLVPSVYSLRPGKAGAAAERSAGSSAMRIRDLWQGGRAVGSFDFIVSVTASEGTRRLGEVDYESRR